MTPTASSPLVPWIELSAYSLRLFLRPGTQGRSSLLMLGATDGHAETLSSLGFEPHGSAGYWYRSFSAGESFRPAEILKAFPEAKPSRLPRSEVVFSLGALGASGAQPDESSAAPVTPATHVARTQRSEIGRVAAQLLMQAGVLESAVPTAPQALIYEAAGSVLRILRQRSPEGRLRVSVAQAVARSRRLNGTVVLELDDAGQLHVAGTSQFDAQSGFVDTRNPILALSLLREAAAGGLATGEPARRTVSLDEPGAVVALSGGAGQTASVTLTSVLEAGAGVAIDAQVEDTRGVVRLRFVDVQTPPEALLDGAWVQPIVQAMPESIVFRSGEWTLAETTQSARSTDVRTTPLPPQPETAVVSEASDERETDSDPDPEPAGDGGSGRASGDDEPAAPAVAGGSDRAPVRADERGGAAGGELHGASGAEQPDHGASEGAGGGVRPAVAGSSRTRRRAPRASGDEGRSNQRLTEAKDSGSFNPRAAATANIQALQALLRIERRPKDEAPEAADLEALKGYIGWGGLPGVFDPRHELGSAFGSVLKDVLSEEEFAAARASTLNAHFTGYPVIGVVWSAMQHLGVAGGVGLEPGAGVGRFIGRAPELPGLGFIAVEKDPLSARILRALYPEVETHACGYEETPLADGSVDFVIGNVPFGDYSVHDPRYRSLRAPIHDYFIIKSLDKLAPGGVMAVITSTGTLDKTNASLREAMYASADLLGAFRMPEGTFRANAGTDVTTDLLVFRKRLPGDVAQPFDWRGTVSLEAADESSVRVNAIFTTPRGVKFGAFVTTTRMYGRPHPAVVARHPVTGGLYPTVGEWAALIREVLPAGVHAPTDIAPAEALPEARRSGPAGSREGSYIVDVQDRVCLLHEGVAEPLKLRRLDERRIRLMIPIRDSVRGLLQAQADACTDAELKRRQEALNTAYDAFVGELGPVNLPVNRRSFIDDPDSVLVLAIEQFDPETKLGAKTDIFHTRTLGPTQRTVTCETPADALAVVINEVGRVDEDRIAELANVSWAACREALRGQIFRDPETGAWEIAPVYLSGHIPRKLDLAKRAASHDPELAENVEALTARLPRALVAEEIHVGLGAPWIGTDVLVEFTQFLRGETRAFNDVTVSHNSVTGAWAVTGNKHNAPSNWGTSRKTAWDLLEDGLNGRSPKVFDTIEDLSGKRLVLNQAQTVMAIERLRQISEAFSRWIWSDPVRTQKLEADYNRIFNGYRSADYAGFEMTVPGMALGRALRLHQAKAVTRGVLERNILLAHPVGFGKTATMASMAMKLRALGVSNKVMIVVPKSVIYQFAGEIVRFFPQARALTIKSSELSPKGRALFWRRVQVTNPDVILVTPEAFKRIRLPKDAEVAYLGEEVGRMEAALLHEKSQRETGGSSETREVKRIERMRAALTARINSLLNTAEKDDNRITLDDLGVTDLFVDEAHRYKNLQVVTSERVLGVPTAASQRASDMHSKVRYIQRGDGRVVFATGSAITNTLAEAYNLQRYLMPEELEEQGVAAFDAWKAQYAAQINSLEPDPAGKGYRSVVRLAELVNVPELVAMLGQVTDAVEDDGAKVGGRPDPRFIAHSVEPTAMQALYREVLAERVAEMRANPKKALEEGDNILVVLGDARRAALDLQAQIGALPVGVGGNKLAEVADTIIELYQRHSDTRSTQAVFLDFATPAARGGSSAWTGYQALTDLLVERGMPRAEVAWIHDAPSDEAKADLFRRVRSGEKRVIIGSTEKMGEGTNMQERMVALHHLNAPYHPGHIVQRNGRAIRQGNLHKEVEIHTYVTKGLLEDWGWHLVTLKDKFIRQVLEGLASHRDGEGLARRLVEDAATMDFATIEAHASDNPLVKDKAVVDALVQKLGLLRDADAQERGQLRMKIGSNEARIESTQRLTEARDAVAAARQAFLGPDADQTGLVAARAAARDALDQKLGELLALAASVESSEGEKAKGRAESQHKARAGQIEEETFWMTVAGNPVLGRSAAGACLLLEIDDFNRSSWQTQRVVAQIEGVDVLARRMLAGHPRLELRVGRLDPCVNTDVCKDPVALIRRVERMLATVAEDRAGAEGKIEWLTGEIEAARAQLATPWPRQAELDEARARQQTINIQLAAMNEAAQSGGPSASERFEESLFVLGHRGGVARHLADEYEALADAGDDDAEDAGANDVDEFDGAETRVTLSRPKGTAAGALM